MNEDVVVYALFVFFFLGIYPLPIYVAACRRTKNQWWVVLVSLFLGWTVIGYFAALIMAAEGKKRNAD